MDVVSYILAKQYTNEKIAEVDPGASGEQALQEIAEAKQDALSGISTETESSIQEVKDAAQQEAASQIANIQSAAQSAAQEAANDIATEKQNAITDLQEEAEKQNASLAGTTAQAVEAINTAADNKVAEINEANSHSPVINEETGKWQLWDEDSKSYVDTDIDADGQKGDPGVGVPAGGTAGQVLVKKTETDYDTEWKDIEGGTSSPVNIYTGTATDEQTDSEVLQQIAPSPNHGDIAVITRVIHGETKSANSYIYNTDGGAPIWQPLNEKYSAEDVYFSSNITITANIGVQTIDSTGSKTLETAGKNLKQVFDMIVAEEKNPSITQPSVTAKLNNSGAKEVGTNITPSYACTLNPGSYQYGPATGIVATSWAVSDTDSNNAETSSGTFPEIQVTESTNYKVTAVATYDDGAIPVTNLSNEYSAGQIKAGSKTGTSAAITGYRNSFYGTLTDKSELPDSATIRTLTKSNKALSNGSKFSINIPVGAIRVVISYPATLRDLTSVTDVNGMGAEISPSFVLNTIQVAGENNYNPVDYKTYILDYANPNNTQNTYNVTI